MSQTTLALDALDTLRDTLTALDDLRTTERRLLNELAEIQLSIRGHLKHVQMNVNNVNVYLSGLNTLSELEAAVPATRLDGPIRGIRLPRNLSEEE